VDLFSLASALGLSAPLTLLAIGLLNAAGLAPPFIGAALSRYPILVSPGVLGLAAVLFLFEVGAGKSKLTRPFKLVIDALHVVIKPLLAAMFAVAVVGARLPVPDGLAPSTSGALVISWAVPGVFPVIMAVLAASLVHLVRTAAEVVVWLSPIPFIDAAVGVLVDAYSIFMVLAALLLPELAAVLCTMQLVVCLFVASHAFRVCSGVASLAGGFFSSRQDDVSTVTPPRAVAEKAGVRGIVPCWARRGGAGGPWRTTWAWVSGGQLWLATRVRLQWRYWSHPLAKVSHVSAAEGVVSIEVAVREGSRALATVAFRLDRRAHAATLIDALSAAGLPLDDARPGGLRLPAALRAAS
jgi:hypothetical protein